MFEFVAASFKAVAENLLQLILGCILAVPVYHMNLKRFDKFKQDLMRDFVLIAAASLLGVVLPIGTYGLIPLLAAMIFAGFRFYTALPAVLSNAVFNMLVPFNDPSFVWATGYRRMVLAFLMAVLAGMALRTLKSNAAGLIGYENLAVLGGKPADIQGLVHNIGRCIKVSGVYLAAGVLINTAFRRYVLWGILSFLSTNSRTAFIPLFFAGYDVANPIFLLAVSIAYLLMDFTKLSAMLVIFKPKGMIPYFGYHAAWIFLLGTSAFV